MEQANTTTAPTDAHHEANREANHPTAKIQFSPAELTIRLDQAWRVLGVNQEIIRSADQKVYLLIVMSAVLATFTANNLERILGLGRLQNGLLIVFLVASAAFFFFALRTLFARAETVKAHDQAPKGNIFFGDIARHASATEYSATVGAIDLHRFLDDLIQQAFHVSHIASLKYIAYRRAWLSLMVEIAVFLMLEFSVALMVK